jgi:outer membrane receptor protein involved in Fe transport
MKTLPYYFAVTTALAGISSVCCPSAVAQVAQPTLEEVFVTAQRRKESAQDVPIAMSVLSEKNLEQMGVDDFVDFARTVPGLQFRGAGPGRTKLSIRGISSGTGAATVGYYIDDVPLPTNNGFVNLVTVDPKLFDIQRVEVLRGPQGTLYGAGSMGGTVKYVTNTPDSTTFGSRFSFTGSSTTHGAENFAVDALANAPLITDRLAVRVLAYYRFEDGFVDRVYGPPPEDFENENDLLDRSRNAGNEETIGGRGVIEYTPTDKARLTFSIFHQSTEMDGLQYVTGGPTNPNMELVFRQPLDVPEPFADEFTLYSLTGSFDFGNLNLTSIASYFERKFNMTEDGTIHLDRFFYTPLGGPLLPGPLEEITDHDSETYEARLSTIEPFHGFHGLIGAFKQERTPLRAANWIVPGANAIYEPLGLPLPDDNFYTSKTVASAEEFAVFGEVSYQFVPSFKATAGVRYFDLKSTNTSVFNGLFGDGGAATSAKFDSTEINTKFALSWEPSDVATLYATVAEGLRPGTGLGFLPDLCDPYLIALGFDPDNPPTQVDPDSVVSYEVGAKTIWLDDRLDLSAAVFNIDWEDIQQTVFLGCGFNILANAGEAQSQGVELELAARPSDRVELAAALTYNDATLEADAPDVGGERGDRIQDVPEWQFGASAQYRFPIQDGYTGFVRADGQYVGKSFVTFDQTNPLYTKPSYTLVNFRAGVETPGGWEVTLFVENAFDELAILALPDSLIFNLEDLPRYSVNRPRTVGITARRNFGL